MAELLAKGIFDLGKKFIVSLRKVKTNKQDGHKLQQLIALVDAVCTDVIPQREDGRIEKDPKVILAMTSLKDGLVEADREVNQYLQRNILMQTIRVDAMTKKLDRLRKDIKDLMDVSQYTIVNETNKDGKENRHMLQEQGSILQGIDQKVDMLHLQIERLKQVQINEDTSSVVVKQRVWTQIQLHKRQQEDTALVSKSLSIPSGVAAVLLRHLNWDPERVQDEWREHGGKLRKAVGLPPSSQSHLGWNPIRDRRERSRCNICFGARGSDAVADAATTEMISACCSHYYCKKCWRRYISVAVREGALRCLSLRCPDPSCKMPVIEELLDMVLLDGEDRDRYNMFARWSYVDNSGGRIKWCPGPDCGRAIEFLGGAGAHEDVMVVVCCDLKHSFCWSCGEEPHRPVSCDKARMWLDTISHREDWVLTFTKRCPKCRRTLENIKMINNVTCSAPCGHRFCWICLHPSEGIHHDLLGLDCRKYRCREEMWLQVYNQPMQIAATSTSAPSKFERQRQVMLWREEDEQHKVVASDYYKLWGANQVSLQGVLNEMGALKGSVIRNMAATLGIDVADLSFLSQAYEEMGVCRRAIRWVYPYGYYHLDPKKREDDQNKCQHLDHLDRLVEEANESLQRLQDLVAEENRLRLFSYGDDFEAFGRAYTAFKTEVADTTAETRHKVEELVKAAENDFQDY